MEKLMIRIAADVNARLARVNEVVSPRVAEEISRMVKEQSMAGRAFGPDRYDREYTEPYKRRRARRGLTTHPVTMRAGANTIERMQFVTDSDGTEISFMDKQMGVIFGYHHRGINYRRVGNRMRSIFPKERSSVPPSVFALAHQLVGELLNAR